MSTGILRSSEHPKKQEAKEFIMEHPNLGTTVRFINGDSFEFLENCTPGSYDAVFTDIPYNVLNGYKGAEFDETPFNIEKLVKLAAKALKDDGIFITFCASTQLERLETILGHHFDGGVRDGVWLKTNPDPKKIGPTNAKENFVVAWRRGSMLHARENRWNAVVSAICSGKEPLKEFDPEKGKLEKVHGTQKPIEMTVRLFNRLVPEGACVLDTCAGTGAIGRASYHSGRHYTGIELDRHFFERGVEAFRDETYMNLCRLRAKKAEMKHGEIMLKAIRRILIKNKDISERAATEEGWEDIQGLFKKLSGYKFLMHSGKVTTSGLQGLILMALLALLVAFLVHAK
jgi:DNA modification methylase